MSYDSVELKGAAFAVLEDNVVKRLVFKKNNNEFLEVELSSGGTSSNFDGGLLEVPEGYAAGLTYPSGGGVYAVTPDSPALSLVNVNFDLILNLDLDAYPPAAQSVFISKLGTFTFIYHPADWFMLYLGSGDTLFLQGEPYAAIAETKPWVKMSFVYAAGGGNSTATFFVSTNGVDWTPHGAVITQPQPTFVDTNTPLYLGAHSALAELPIIGKLFEAKIISDSVVKFDATFEIDEAGTFNEDSPNAALVTVVKP